MTVDELMHCRDAIPFRAFVLVLKDGTRLEIRDPTAIGPNVSPTQISVKGQDSPEPLDIGLISRVEPATEVSQERKNDVKKLRELRLAHPFQPFYLLLDSGDRILVDKPYHFALAPDGSRMGVVATDGVRLLFPSMIKGVEVVVAAR